MNKVVNPSGKPTAAKPMATVKPTRLKPTSTTRAKIRRAVKTVLAARDEAHA